MYRLVVVVAICFAALAPAVLRADSPSAAPASAVLPSTVLSSETPQPIVRGQLGVTRSRTRRTVAWLGNAALYYVGERLAADRPEPRRTTHLSRPN